MSDKVMPSAIKGWLAGCLVASAVFFLFGLKTQLEAPQGLSPRLLLFGFLWSMIQFFVIAIFTAAPAALFIWLAKKHRIQHIALFAGFGALLGLLAQVLFNPLGIPKILLLFVFAGAAAGVTYWFVTEKGDPEAGAN
jgi:hypothetical protein